MIRFHRANSRKIVDSQGRNFPYGVFLPRSELYEPGVVWQFRVRQISRVQVEQSTQISARWQSHKQVLHLIKRGNPGCDKYQEYRWKLEFFARSTRWSLSTLAGGV